MELVMRLLPPWWFSGLVFVLLARFVGWRIFWRRGDQGVLRAIVFGFVATMVFAAGFVGIRYYRATHWGVGLEAREIVRRGDPAVFRLKWKGFPAFETMAVSLKFRTVTLEIAGEPFAPALAGSIRHIPEYATQNAFPAVQAIDLPPALLARLPDGPVKVRCEVEVTTEFIQHVSTRREWLSTSFELVAAKKRTVRLVTPPTARLGVLEAYRAYARGDLAAGEMGITLSRWPGRASKLEIAGDVMVVAGKRAVKVGTLPATDEYPIQNYWVNLTEEEMLGAIDVVVVPNERVAARTVGIFEIWGDPVTYPVERIK
jgi:hypothetical protein